MIGGKIIYNANEEVGVFKIKQQPKVQYDTTDEQCILGFFIGASIDKVTNIIIENGSYQNKSNIPTTGFIKEIKGKQGEQINLQSIETITDNINQQEEPKEKQEERTVEQQWVFLVVEKGIQ